MKKSIIATENAPSAIGPYNQAVTVNGLVYSSGQIPLDPESMLIISDDVQEQTEQVMKNLAAVLEAAGSSLDKVIKTTCFLASMDDFVAFNEVYSKYFPESAPARSCVEVAKLPLNALVEVEAIAICEQ